MVAPVHVVMVAPMHVVMVAPVHVVMVAPVHVVMVAPVHVVRVAPVHVVMVAPVHVVMVAPMHVVMVAPMHVVMVAPMHVVMVAQPIINDEDQEMNVVWHAHYDVTLHAWKLLFQLEVPFQHHLACIIQLHLAILDGAEQRCSVLSYDGNETCTWLRVVVTPKSCASTIVPLLLVFHTTIVHNHHSNVTFRRGDPAWSPWKKDVVALNQRCGRPGRRMWSP